MTAAEAKRMDPIDPKSKFVTFDLYGTLTHFQMSALTRTLFSDRVPSGRMSVPYYRYHEIPDLSGLPALLGQQAGAR